ncbi:MAG: hypothetical protein ABSG15_00140 [FCB group bacterium]
MRKYYIVILLLLNSWFLFAQVQENYTDSYPKIGIFSDFNLNKHTADFQKLPGVPNCCPSFESGTGSGVSLGFLYDIPFNNHFSLTLRAGYSVLNGKLSKIEDTFVREDSNVVPGKFEHTIDAKISDIGIEPIFTYNTGININLHAGTRLGLLAQKSYEQMETITEPSDRGVFVDSRSRTRNHTSGSLPQASAIYLALLAGISYDLPLNKDKSLLLSPEFYYDIGLTNLVSNTNWKVSSIKFGLALIYSPKPLIHIQREKNIKEFNIDTVMVETYKVINPTLKQGIPDIKNRKSLINDTTYIVETITRTDTLFQRAKPVAVLNANSPKVTMEYISKTIQYPLLPVIFFFKSSWTISDYYYTSQNKNNFEIEQVPPEPLQLHKNILNIIGLRLTNNPGTKISLKGYIDPTTEGKDCNIALMRMKSIKDYFIKTWGIESNRINLEPVENDCYPKRSPQTIDSNLYAENKHVEILSDDYPILAPVSKDSIVELKSTNTEKLNISTQGSTKEGIKKWNITGTFGLDTLFNITKSGAPQDVSFPMTLEQSVLNRIKNIDISFYLLDSAGNETRANKTVQLQKDISKTEIQRMMYILFDVSDENLLFIAKKQIEDFVFNIKSATNVFINGFSDVVGPEKTNLTLSQNRAKNTSDYVHTLNPNLKTFTVKGHGTSKFPDGINSYSTPSERFLSRSVQIEIRLK